MEKNINADTYLTLSKKALKATKAKASKEAIEEIGDAGKDDLYYGDSTWDIDEFYFDRDSQNLILSGELINNGEKIGYLSPKIQLGHKTVMEIIEFYMEKLEKLRTVMRITR